MSAGDAFEQRLRLAIDFGNTAAYRAGATCILRRHRMNVSAQSQRLPFKLVEENPPALIENGTVETALLWLFRLSRDEERNKEERDKIAGSAAWLKKMSLRQFLGWFDCVETVTVKNKRAKTRWSTESTMRDRLVLHMLEKNMTGPLVEG